MPRNTGLIERYYAAAIDAESGRTKAFDLAYQFQRVYLVLVAFTQVDEEHPIRPLPPSGLS